MNDGRKLHIDLIIIVLLLSVAVGGFWMTGKVADARNDEMKAQLQVVDNNVKLLIERVNALQVSLNEHGKSPAAPQHAPAPVAPAPAAK